MSETKKPRTEAQRQASRRNGAKSRGPKTEAGKARSSRNSLSHGLTAHSMVIDGESEDDWKNLELDYHAEWQPVGPTECDLVTQLAYAAFRLRRLIVLEPARVNYEQAKLQPRLAKAVPNFDRPLKQSLAYEQSMRQIDSLGRYEARLKRQIKDTILLLQQLQDRRKAEAQKAEQLKSQNEPNLVPNVLSINDMIRIGAVEGLGPNDPWTRNLNKIYRRQPPPKRETSHESLDPKERSPEKLDAA